MEPIYFDCPNCGNIEIPEPQGFYIYSDWDECDKLICDTCFFNANLEYV